MLASARSSGAAFSSESSSSITSSRVAHVVHAARVWPHEQRMAAADPVARVLSGSRHHLLLVHRLPHRLPRGSPPARAARMYTGGQSAARRRVDRPVTAEEASPVPPLPPHMLHDPVDLSVRATALVRLHQPIITKMGVFDPPFASSCSSTWSPSRASSRRGSGCSRFAPSSPRFTVAAAAPGARLPANDYRASRPRLDLLGYEGIRHGRRSQRSTWRRGTRWPRRRHAAGRVPEARATATRQPRADTTACRVVTSSVRRFEVGVTTSGSARTACPHRRGNDGSSSLQSSHRRPAGPFLHDGPDQERFQPSHPRRRCKHHRAVPSASAGAAHGQRRAALPGRRIADTAWWTAPR